MFRFLLYTVTTIFVLAAPTYAQWEQLGPGGGGQVRLIASDPSAPNRVYLGSDVAGLWRTTSEYGAFSTDPQYEYLTRDWSIRFCQDIAFDTTTNPVGLFIAAQTGVYYSADDGDTWVRLGNDGANGQIDDVPLTSDGAGQLSKVSSVAVVRYGAGNNQLRVYAGVGNLLAKQGQLSHATGKIWVYESVDDVNGNVETDNDWTSKQIMRNSNDVEATIYKVVANAANADQLWVSTEDGVFYSPDAGVSWEERSEGLEANNKHCRDIVVNPDPTKFDTDARLVVKGIDRENISRDEYLEPKPDPTDKLPGGYYRWKQDPVNSEVYKWFRVERLLQYHKGDSLTGDKSDAVIEWNTIAIDEKSAAAQGAVWGNFVFVGSATEGEAAIQYSDNGNNITFNGGNWNTRSASGSVADTGWQRSGLLISNPHSLHYDFASDAGGGVGTGRLWVGKSGNFFRSNANIAEPAPDHEWRQEYTTNGGTDLWTHRGMVNTTVRGVTNRPGDPDHIFTAQGDRGISESTDRIHFKEVEGITLYNSPTLARDGFFVSFPIAGDSNTIFASANNSTAAATGGVSVLYKSDDAGGSWFLAAGGDPKVAINGLPGLNLEYWDITAVPDDANSPLWLGTVKRVDDISNITTRTESGVYQSPNSGDNWSQVLTGPDSLQTESVVKIQAVPQSANPN